MTSKWIIGIIVVILVIWGIYSVANKPQVSQEPIKIGVIAPFTGKAATWGESIRNGITLAMERVNADGGVNGREVQVIFEDDQLDVKNSVSAFNKLVNIDNVSAIIGPGGSSNAKAVVPLLQEKKVPAILTAVGVSDITQGNDYIFRIWPSEVQKAKAMSPALEKLGYKKVAVITTNNESPLDMIEQLKLKVFPGLEIETVYEEVVDRDTTDFRTVLAKVKSVDFDALFINLYAGQVGVGIKQAKEMGITEPMFSNILADSSKELELAQGAMEGVWFPGSPVPSNNFLEEYKNRFGIDSQLAAPSSYDALMFYVEAIKRVGTDREKIRQELYKIKNYEGAFGNISFDEEGDASLDIPLKTIKNGEFVKYE